MGLFSFGNKDAAPARRSRTSAGADRHGEPRAARASSRAAGGRSGQESLLDPTLPEKQRARRRLVGAIALVLAAVVVLPMVLDSHPKPASDDIAVNIPRPAKAAVPAAATASVNNPPAPEVPPAEDGPADNPAPAVASAPAQPAMAVKPAAGQASARLGASATKPEPATTHTSASVAGAASHPGADQTHPSTSNAAASRFVVSVGSFTSEASAHAWLNKLKAAGVPVYLESKRLPDGTQRTLLRAGPFNDRASAESAVKKVRGAGLSAQASAAAAPGTAP